MVFYRRLIWQGGGRRGGGGTRDIARNVYSDMLYLVPCDLHSDVVMVLGVVPPCER